MSAPPTLPIAPPLGDSQAISIGVGGEDQLGPLPLGQSESQFLQGGTQWVCLINIKYIIYLFLLASAG